LIRLSTFEIAYWQFKDLNPPPLLLVTNSAPLEAYLEWYIPQQEFSPYTDYVLNCLNIIGTTLTIEQRKGEFALKYPLECFCQERLTELDTYLDTQVKEAILAPIPDSSALFFNNPLDALSSS
jgi:hypothetical protein